MNTTLYSGRYFEIVTDSDGTEVVRAGDEVLVVPLTETSQVMMTIEPSVAFGEPTLILPGGSVEPGEPHAKTANRELQEEIGYRAEHLQFLGELRPYSKYLTVRSYIYLARGLTPSRLGGDEPYEIQIEQVDLAEFEDLVAAGRLLDARVIAALYMARGSLNLDKRGA